jgi:hypothetical protein
MNKILTPLYFLMQCLQYKTDKQADLKKIEKLHHIFFALMATGKEPVEDVEMAPADAAAGRRKKR